MDYGYSVIDSTRLTDLLKGLLELFINVRVKSGDILFLARESTKLEHS
jgi:hypothetical protein